MSDKSFSVHVSYASVDRADGGDVRPAVRGLLSDLRVVSAIRDANAPWEEGQEAVVEIAVTDDAKVLTLSAEDTIETTLTAQELRDAFTLAGMTLWLSVDDDQDDEDDVTETWDDDAPADGSAPEDFADSEESIFDETELEAIFEEKPVRVAAFSHRAPMMARFLAELTHSSVDYVEADSWSLCLYATTDSTPSFPPSKAEAPVIELNLVGGEADWIEVRLSGVMAHAVPFWPQGERDTQPIIDPETITVPETREIYQRLITEGDGTRDDLVEIARELPLDVDAAHRALMPESLGGVVGADERIRAFLAAFQVPAELIDLALAAEADALASARRIEPRGWARAIGDVLVDGYGETVPLTRRGRWDARLSRGLRAKPALATALSAGELVLGVLGTRHLRGGWKSVGIFLILDAVGELVVGAVRRKRR